MPTVSHKCPSPPYWQTATNEQFQVGTSLLCFRLNWTNSTFSVNFSLCTACSACLKASDNFEVCQKHRFHNKATVECSNFTSCSHVKLLQRYEVAQCLLQQYILLTYHFLACFTAASKPKAHSFILFFPLFDAMSHWVEQRKQKARNDKTRRSTDSQHVFAKHLAGSQRFRLGTFFLVICLHFTNMTIRISSRDLKTVREESLFKTALSSILANMKKNLFFLLKCHCWMPQTGPPWMWTI